VPPRGDRARPADTACRSRLIHGLKARSPVALGPGVTKTHSRPHVSNDNPYSESHFKTLKYRPGFPDRFGAPEHARGFSQDFFRWYNFEHHHSGLGLLTPADVHLGRAPERVAARGRVLEAAYARYPERFVGGLPQPAALPTAVWINKLQQPEKEPCMPAVAH
jgi:putative transposase